MRSVRCFTVTLLLLVALTTAAAQDIKLEIKPKSLEPGRLYTAMITVTTPGTDGAATPVDNQELTVRVVRSDAVIVESDGHKTSTNVTTGTDGTATVSVLTQTQPSFTLDIVPVNSDGVAMDDDRRQFTAKDEIREVEESLFSRRVFTEVFIGSTFTNDYAADTKQSIGFSEAAPVARVTFDTIWPGNVKDGVTDEEDKAVTDEEDKAHMFRGSLLHSGINMQFASFPFGEDAEENEDDDETNDTVKGFDEAFTGSFYVLWQPNWGIFRSYTPTSTRPGIKYDAMRIGILGVAGMTTRANVDTDGDTSIRRTQLGFKFTHHQTTRGTPHLDQENTVPIRFVEITWGHFEQYGTTLDGKPRKGANRLMIDAGVRLPGMGGNLVPFYAGIHFNGGPGTDDLRVFAGFLFKVNEIARAFRRANNEDQ